MQSPQVLLADEPTASLDDQNCRIRGAIAGRAGTAAHAALLIVTHDNRLKQLFRDHIQLS